MKPTSADDWKKAEEPFIITLPTCKRTIKLRRAPMASLVRKGVIPTHLYKLATGQQKEVHPEEMTPQMFQDLVQLMVIYATVSAIEPRIVNTDEVPADAIHVDMLEDDDLSAIFMASRSSNRGGGKPSPELRSFPDQPEGAPDRPVGAEVSSEAVKPAGA